MLPFLAILSLVPSDDLVVDNGQIRLTFDKALGSYSVGWPGSVAVEKIVGEARLADGKLVRTTEYSRHDVETAKVKDAFGVGTRVTVHNRAEGLPELRQTFWVYDKRAEVMVRLDLVGSTGSNYLAPVTTETRLSFGHEAPLRALFVPWDNDNYFRYRSDGWGEGEGDGDGSYEVGALYDDVSRRGLVVGSIDHDRWKSAVRFKRGKDGEVDSLRAFAGVTSKYTHDAQPHGTVTGRVVSSPRMVLGLYSDWRDGLERYGDLNAMVRPPLAWPGEKPFFWNSWSGHKFKVSAADARGATDFVHDRLPGFRSGGTAFINFDAGAGNLSPEQMEEFIKHAHSLGLRAGIYWTPFACWWELDKPAGDGKTFRDLVLKDDKGQPLPKLDGAYPFDPSNPAVLKRIDDEIKKFVAQGFDYSKMDFVSHGALEGHHFDPKIQTGTQAYALGMKRIAEDVSPKRIGRPFFLSLSIAPLFPHGVAHSRRVSCDVFANIGASEYLLNSANYAWWEAGRLYRFSDPDSATVYQASGEDSTTEAEARTRFVASVVSGGMMILGDDLGNPAAQARVLKLFGNDAALEIARRDSPFRPVNGDTDYAGGDAFVRVNGGTAYVALFNFDKKAAKHREVSLSRLGLAAGDWAVHDVLSGRDWKVGGDLAVDLPAMDCVLLKLTKG